MRASRQCPLRVFTISQQLTFHIRIIARVDTPFPNELFRYGVNQSLIPIAAPQVDIAVSRQRNEIASLYLHDRDVECTTPQIVNQNLSRYIRTSVSCQVPLFVAKRYGSGSWLVDDIEHLETSHVASILGGLSPHLVEIGGNRNHYLLKC